jgi:hypothetical protein
MSSASYSIPSLTISSGGHTGLQSTSYKLQDIKGQAVIGYGSSASYGLGIGGVYGTLPPREEGISAWSVDPHVSNLRIRRDGTTIYVYWDTDLTVMEGMSPNFYIYAKEGPFENISTNWTYYGVARGRTYFGHADQVGTGLSQVYYRVISENVKENLTNKPSVGKINITANTGWNQFAVPFIPMAVNESVGVNFTAGDQLWAWRRDASAPPGGAFVAPIRFDGTNWGTEIEIAAGEGYGLKIVSTALPAGTVKTLIGAVKAGAFSRAVANGWNLIGNPYAKNLVGSSGLTGGRDGDQLWEWNAFLSPAAGFLAPKRFNGTAWSSDPNLEIGKGYGYKHLGSGFNWQLTAPIY